MTDEDLQWKRIGLAISALAHLRIDYLLRAGLPRAVLNTQFNFVSEANRRPLANVIIPLLSDANQQATLQDALLRQEEWPAAEFGKSAWQKTRQMAEAAVRQGLEGLEDVFSEDLLLISYGRVIEGLAPDASGLDTNSIRRGVEDVLLNEFYLCAEMAFAFTAAGTRQVPSPPSEQPAGTVIQLLSYADLVTQMHLQNAVNRLRAGWDKLMTNLVFDGLSLKNPPDRFLRKVRSAEMQLAGRLSLDQEPLFANLVRNARDVAQSPLVRLRDSDLHFISQQATETFGRPGVHPALQDFWTIVLNEHQRLDQSFLLLIGVFALPSGDAPARDSP